MKRILLGMLVFSSVLSHAAGPEVKVYRGTSHYNSDIVATVRDGRVYSGRSSYRSDILFTIGGSLTVEEFVAVWHYVGNTL